MMRDTFNETERARAALWSLDPGCDRETWVRYGMSAKAAGLEFDDFHSWSASAGNYKGEPDCRAVWNSIKDGGVTAATLFRAALANGWQDDSAQGQQKAHSTRQLARPIPKAKPTEIAPQKSNPAVSELWGRCELATGEHPYIVAKQGRPDGLRIVGASDTAAVAGQSVAEWLVVPVLSLDGELRTLQLIPPPGIGKKLNLPGASFGDGVFVVGELAQSPRGFVVEGIGQAWACWRATGHAAVVCFGAGRMGAVAALLRKRFASLPLVVVPDKGKEQQAATIARAIGGAWVELPDDKPANYDANDYAAEYGADVLAALLDKTKAPERRYRVLAADDLLNTPPLRWLVRGVVPAQGLACMYGASGSGKSFLALDMCAAVAGGAEWFDCRVTAASVTYVALEGEHGFRQRVNAWQQHHGRDIPNALRFVMQPFDLRNSDDMVELADAVIASGGAGGLLIIDTLNRASGGADENSSKDMGEIIDAAKGLQAKLGGTVLLIHHSGKDATKGLRGHSSLHAALDAAVEVRRDGDRREWVIAKSKDDGDSAAYPFRLEVIEIGTDEHGDPLTSCAVEPDDRKAEFRRVLPPKSGNMRVVWDALGEILRHAGDYRPKDAPERLPFGRPAVKVETAIEKMRDRLACDAKRKTERVQQALTGLQAKGLILIDGGYVWIA
jgi:putative DNA primase/helicase